ncbi:MAG: hypothetical protein ACT4OZ_06005 [Gemmatimonadota bacterium]
MRSSTCLFAVLVTVVQACNENAGSRDVAPPAALSSATGAMGSDSVGCRLSGLWQVCSVEDRLDRAGLVVERVEFEEPRALLPGTVGRVYRVGGPASDDRIEVYLWITEAERAHSLADLDSATLSPAGERRSWPVMPLLVTSANLAAVVFTPNPRTGERVSLALSAGLPPAR